MKAVYLVSPVRSAVAKAFRGALASKRPDDLLAEVIQACLKRTPELDPQLIEDVLVGCAMPEAEQGMNVARFALLLAGLPERVPGQTINRFCSSGVQTIGSAAYTIMAGGAECLLAGGTESMSLVPMMGHKPVGNRSVFDSGHDDYYLSMGITAENVAKDYNVSREAQDEFSLNSHVKAAQAIEKGLFKEEIVSVKATLRRPQAGGLVEVKTQDFHTDEGPRADSTLKALSALKPAFQQGGSVTAGNSSQMSDGAAVCILASEDFVKRHNLKPKARFLSYAVAGVPPRIMGIGPVEAIPKALKLAGLKLDQIDRIELNEAFAAQSLAVIKNLNIDPAKVNPTGGAIALGHPLGATGAKLAATVVAGLHRDQQKYGLVTMCIGTGMGAAMLVEKV